MSIIQSDKLNFSYQKNRQVLYDIDFDIEEGESIGLIGPNGAGKSTLLRLLVGLEEGHTGRLLVDSIEVNKKNIAEVRKKQGYIFQDSDNQLFMSTIYEDVAFGPANMGLKGEELKSCVEEALDKVHITDIKDRQVYRISGGQKKLAAIATVLAMKPEILLFDEPSVALDPRNRRNLIKVINELQATKIIASHDIDFIKNTCDKVIFLSEGRILSIGKTEEILNNEKLLFEGGL